MAILNKKHAFAGVFNEAEAKLQMLILYTFYIVLDETFNRIPYKIKKKRC